MRYRRLGDSDLQVSMVALGCGCFGGFGAIPEFLGLGETEQQARAVLDAAHENGITLFDTANTYGAGQSEEWIGRWLAGRPSVRDELVITTKVGTPVGPGEGDRGLSAAHIRSQLERSLRRMGLDHVDLYLSHEPDPATPLDETLRTFDDLIRAGKIRHYGLANVDATEIAAVLAAADALGVPGPVNVQVGHNLLDPAPAATLDLCRARGIGVTAFSALAGGWLAGAYRAGSPYPPRSRMAVMPERYRLMERLAEAGVLTALGVQAQARGIALPTLALAWLLSDPVVSAGLTAPQTPEQLTPALAAVDHLLDDAGRAHVTAIVEAARVSV
ncbi:MAG TPA: aldo/keto reductase [Micromonosporaceae bacterium]|nr:aldo/keto reductase [Micromonosporaceae bacterium]